MYDEKKARELGLTAHCVARLRDPVTVSGMYRCDDGHIHRVQWRGRAFVTSETGYDPSFLGALNRADDAAICAGDPGTLAYVAAHNAVLSQEGYRAVLLGPLTSLLSLQQKV